MMKKFIFGAALWLLLTASPLLARSENLEWRYCISTISGETVEFPCKVFYKTIGETDQLEISLSSLDVTLVLSQDINKKWSISKEGVSKTIPIEDLYSYGDYFCFNITSVGLICFSKSTYFFPIKNSILKDV